jgi:hypothetical protein
VIILLRANEKIKKRQPLTRNIAKKGIFVMRSSSPASSSVYLESDVLRIPFQAILPPLGHMQNNTTDTLIMTSNERQIEVQTDFHIGLTQLDRQYNTTRTTEKETEIKIPRFAFLKISANAHLAHLQSRTSQRATKALQKSQILPTLKTSII